MADPTLSVRSTPNSDRKLRGLGLRRKVPQPAADAATAVRGRQNYSITSSARNTRVAGIW
jgi:hypothetical protein